MRNALNAWLKTKAISSKHEVMGERCDCARWRQESLEGCQSSTVVNTVSGDLFWRFAFMLAILNCTIEA
jgi:hypothetical protein